MQRGERGGRREGRDSFGDRYLNPIQFPMKIY